MNMEHYSDYTADMAIRNSLPKAGQIWSDDSGWMYVILKNQGRYCNVLTMVLTGNPVYKVGEYSVDPARVTFLKESKYGNFVRKLTDSEYNNLLAEVSAKFCVEIMVIRHEANADVQYWKGLCEQMIDTLTELRMSMGGH